MNAKQLIAAVAVFVSAGSAFAAAGYTPPAEGFVSSKSRAEVVSELKQARANGELSGKEYVDSADIRTATAPRSREEVRAEAAQAAKAHRTAGINDLYFGA
jgi:hypothetical protein